MRNALIAIYMDWRNNYLSLERYAECNALTTHQAQALIDLARDVTNSEHPET